MNQLIANGSDREFIVCEPRLKVDVFLLEIVHLQRYQLFDQITDENFLAFQKGPCGVCPGRLLQVVHQVNVSERRTQFVGDVGYLGFALLFDTGEIVGHPVKSDPELTDLVAVMISARSESIIDGLLPQTE
jgi:hypothetical protein